MDLAAQLLNFGVGPESQATARPKRSTTPGRTTFESLSTARAMGSHSSQRQASPPDSREVEWHEDRAITTR